MTFKPTGADLETLTKAASKLKKANALFSVAKKDLNAAKTAIRDWLKSERHVNPDDLQIGDMIMIEGICLIVCNKQNRLDQDGLLLAEPALFEKWKKDFPSIWFKPLV